MNSHCHEPDCLYWLCCVKPNNLKHFHELFMTATVLYENNNTILLNVILNAKALFEGLHSNIDNAGNQAPTLKSIMDCVTRSSATLLSLGCPWCSTSQWWSLPLTRRVYVIRTHG